MAPKAATAAAAKASKPAAQHPSFQDMIKDAIAQLKDRQGSGRPSLKKFIRANHSGLPEEKSFDTHFNRALKNGVAKGIFEQPKGPSGGVKLARAQPKAAAPKTTKVGEKKATTTKKPAVAKKTAAPKEAAAKKTAAPKKAAATKKAPTDAAKPKASAATTKKPAATKPSTTDKSAATNKTKTGRVSKAKPASPAKKKATSAAKTAKTKTVKA